VENFYIRKDPNFKNLYKAGLSRRIIITKALLSTKLKDDIIIIINIIIIITNCNWVVTRWQ